MVLALVVLAVALLAGCAAGPNELADTPNAEGEVAGFWMGLWHGVIAPITFILSLFNDNIAIYAVHNNGGWYDFGFLLALTAVWGGGGSSAGRARRRRSD